MVSLTPTPQPARVLVADPEAAHRRDLARALLEQGQEVLTAESAEAALSLARSTRLDVALIGSAMATLQGEPLLESLQKLDAPPEVIALTLAGGFNQSLLARGAYGVIEKGPALGSRALAAVEQARERRHLREQVARLRDETTAPEMVGTHRLFRRAVQLARSVAQAPNPVHIEGEPGTGKELMARCLHAWGRGARGPFLSVSANALPASGLDLSLQQRCEGGTLYLEELDQLVPEAQHTLDQVLQRPHTFRLITATTRPLFQAVQAGSFRRDLFARVSVVTINLLPLRQRREDISLLADHILRQVAQRSGRDTKRLSPEATRLLRAQRWPGNIRELENTLERAVLLSPKSTLYPGDLSPVTPSETPNPKEATMTTKNDFTGLSLPTGWDELPYADAKERALDSFHAAYLGALLRRTGGNISEAARRAGLDRSNFRRVLKRYGNPLAPKPGAAAPTAASPTAAAPSSPEQPKLAAPLPALWPEGNAVSPAPTRG